MSNLMDLIQKNDLISDDSQKSSIKSIFSQKIKSIPKKDIHPLLFFLNVFWMLFCCHANVYYVFGSGKQMEMKGKIAGIVLGFTVIIGLPTFLYLVSLKQLLRLFILFDNIMVLTLAAALSFVSLMFLFDETDEWFWTVIQIGFSIQLAFYSTMTRVFLVHLTWPKWQLIAFKLSAMMNCLMFLISGSYFISVNFSYTQHFLIQFDNKVHDFMLLFIFSLFSYSYELYSKVTDLDHTGDLRYKYTLKNVDSTLIVKTKDVIKKRRESINSINLLRKSFQIKNENQNYKFSRFAQIENIQ